MKILMIHPHDLYSPMEPWTIRVLRLADELGKRGHEVQLVYFPLNRREENAYRGIRILPLDRAISVRAFWKNTALLCEFAAWADVIHLQKSHFYAAVPAAFAAYRTGKPLHYDWDDWEEKIFYASVRRKSPTTLLTGLSFFMMERCLPLLADSMSVASEALKRLALRRGARKEKVVMVPVGGDLQQFRPDRLPGGVRKKYGIKDALIVLYHGQLHSCQYVRQFLQAIKSIAGKSGRSGLKFMILGSGTELGPLQAYAADLGVMDRVIFTDFVPHADVPEYVAAADICVAPFEDNEVTRCKSPLKVVEYLASGKPIVASDVGEVRNMVEGAGILVAPGDAEALAGGILKLADHEALRKELGAAARGRAETRYNWSVSAENLERAYQAHFPDRA
ncbi:MAG: glycosyltransferase family 4 protein [Candidatus Omnitrophica bacterium]|nr:glycosyltransferase family 4 protein [Candidatus Omnitrophota bacterium]